jgi:hypothetical protein
MADQPLLAAGLGLKPEHYAAAHACRDAGLWFEVHAENYMIDGGPRLAWLERIRGVHPVSVHGVGMSLAGDAPPDRAHLNHFTELVRRIEPVLVSEHLAWSQWRGAYRPDLLPVPRTQAVLHRVVDNVDRVQQRIGRPIALENPSHYLRFHAQEFDELEFLSEIARRSGCRLLLDVNNAFVSANNVGGSAAAFVDAVPAELVAEVHLAGHSEDPQLGKALLIDSHDRPVAPEVWSLYERLIARIGPRPTLIERDGNVPAFDELRRDTARAALALRPLEKAA